MAETGDLIIKIGGDASKFKATIADVENSLKSFKANLGTTGLNIKIEALGFQETKSNIKSVTDFAEGTLGAVKNTIKEINQQRLSISADPNALAPFNIKLNELKTSVKELEQAGILKNVPVEVKVAENSLQGLSNKLTELRKQRAVIDPDTNARAILQINQQIEKLQEKIVNLNNLGQKISTPSGLAGGFNGIKKGSSEAGRALTSLSLIAQDLPFGFIAIQNNLPAVIQTFGQLKTAAPGAGGALKALGSALVGPAGLFLAFSAVTGAVTFAIQEYGSLGAAVDALFGKVNPLRDVITRINKDYQEYNKTLKSNAEISALAEAQQSASITTVEILASKATDLSLSEQDRGKYLDQLKKIDKEYYGQLSASVSDVDKIRQATDNYTNSLIANSAVKAYQSQLDAIEAQIAPLKVLREELKTNLENAKQLDKFNQRAISQAAKLGGGAVGGSLGDPIGDATKLLDENASALESLYKKRDQFIIGLTESIDQLRNVISPVVDEATGGGASGSKSSTKAKVAKVVKEDEFDAAKANIQALFAAFKLEDQARENRLKKIKEDAKVEEATFKELIKNTYGAEIPPPLNFDKAFEGLNLNNTDISDKLKEQEEVFKRLRGIIDEVLFNPLTGAFENFLDTGKFAFKEFADEALKQLKRVAASEAAKLVIRLISDLLLPGSGAAASFLEQKTGAGDAIGRLIGGGSQANFGGIRGNQGVNMAGQVVMTLRGSDLVGAINRTNTSISRVG